MNWPSIPLNDILHLQQTSVILDEHTIYKQAALRPYPRAIALNAVKPGLEFPRKRQKLVRSGQFVISKRHARRKLWGIVSTALDGAVIELGSLVFDLQSGLSADYFAAYLSTTLFRQSVFDACSQHGYLSVQQFGNSSIPLPSLEDQYRVAELWKSAKATLLHTREMYQSIAALKTAVWREWRQSTNVPWEMRTLVDCAEIGRDLSNCSLTVIPPDQIVLGTASSGKDCIGIRADFEVESLYLYYFLENQKAILQPAQDLAQLDVRLRSLEFPLPTFYEQRKIAFAMQQHDEALKRIRVELIELRKLVDAIFHRLFTGTLDLDEALPIVKQFLAVDTEKA